MDTAADNGKVTLAILGEQMRQTNHTLARIEKLLAEHIKDDTGAHSDLDKRARDLENGAGKRDTQITRITQDVESLRQKDTWGSVISGALASLGVAIGILKP